MRRRASDHCVPSSYTIVNVQTMNDDVDYTLNGDASTIGYVNVSTTSINGFLAVHNQFLFQCYHHISFEDNPQWLNLDDGVA